MTPLNQDMKLKFVTFRATKLAGTSDAFSLLLDKWDEERLENYKEAKAIFLNENDEAFEICDIPSNEKDIPIEKKGDLHWEIKPVFNQARKKNAKAIIIAQNRLPIDIFADNKRIKLFEEFSTTASNYNLILEDLISMGSTTCSSMRLQGFAK